MAETIHVNDEGTVIYINVLNEGVALDTDLSGFTTRNVKIKRPVTAGLITITAVPVEVDANDSVTKLKLITGTDTGTTLTGNGLFKVPSTDTGDWTYEVILAGVSGSWTSDTGVAFTLTANLSA